MKNSLFFLFILSGILVSPLISGAEAPEINRTRSQAFNNFSEAIEESKSQNLTPSALKEILKRHVEVLARTHQEEEASFRPPADEARHDFDSKTDPFMEYRLSAEDLHRIGLFLKNNKTDATGMPLSYQVPQGFWKKIETPYDGVPEIIERLILAHGLSIYDAAVWEIALGLLEKDKASVLIDPYFERLKTGQSGALQIIRAWDDPFRYGDKETRMKPTNAYFFRIIADEYTQTDPKDGAMSFEGFPNLDLLHHEDWKPITGEQAWAAVIGPLQTAYRKYHGKVPFESDEVRLALSLLPAWEAMQSPIGAIYHAPHGTHGKHGSEISNENNFSMLAALRMLKQVIKGKDRALEERIEILLSGIETYFSNYVFDKKQGVFYQGGYYFQGEFIPNEIFAVDCQTWGSIVMGREWIDSHFGEGTAYQIWERTKKLSGYFDGSNILKGIGFTEEHSVFSSDWTCGAILNARLLSKAYETTRPDWALQLKKDAISMRHGVERLKVETPHGGLAYLYANTRTFIPFGWWANPVPSLAASAWVVMIDLDFNPFVLGGRLGDLQ